MLDPIVAEWLKSISATLLALLAIYTAYRLARSKAQIVVVKPLQRLKEQRAAIRIVNAGETTVFIDECGIIGPLCEPIDILHSIDVEFRLEPGQGTTVRISERTDHPKEYAGAVHAWVDLHSGRRITSHAPWNPRRVLTKLRARRSLWGITWRSTLPSRMSFRYWVAAHLERISLYIGSRTTQATYVGAPRTFT